MSFADAASRANKAINAVMGVTVTYVAGSGRRRLTATQGDVQVQAVPTGRGTEMRSTCPWMVRDADLRPLLGQERPKRGHRLEVEDPTSGTQIWMIEYPTMDTADGWTLYTVLATTCAAGAQGAEAVR